MNCDVHHQPVLGAITGLSEDRRAGWFKNKRRLLSALACVVALSACTNKKTPVVRDNPCANPNSCEPAKLLPQPPVARIDTDAEESGATTPSEERSPDFTLEYMPLGSGDGLRGTVWNYYQVQAPAFGATAYFAEWISPLSDLDGNRSASPRAPETITEPGSGRAFLVRPDALLYGDATVVKGEMKAFGLRFYLKFPATPGETYDEIDLARKSGFLSAEEESELTTDRILVTVGEETLDAPNGTYKALTYSFDLPEDVDSYKLHFVPGIGLVRMDWKGRHNVVQMLQPSGTVHALRARIPARMQSEYQGAIRRWEGLKRGAP